MIQSTTSFRVRYAEVDSMGYVYYGNYAQYFELGRVALLRAYGLPYSELEKMGIWLPVSEMKINYRQPAKYDELITVKTEIREMPLARITFFYEIINEEGCLLTSGETTLYFFDPKNNKVMRCPPILQEILEKNWPK